MSYTMVWAAAMFLQCWSRLICGITQISRELVLVNWSQTLVSANLFRCSFLLPGMALASKTATTTLACGATGWARAPRCSLKDICSSWTKNKKNGASICALDSCRCPHAHQYVAAFCFEIFASSFALVAHCFSLAV
jgi:hypothetical protein